MTYNDPAGSVPALRTSRLGRRYGRMWGLRDCTLEVPAGAIAGLVGPNRQADPGRWSILGP